MKSCVLFCLLRAFAMHSSLPAAEMTYHPKLELLEMRSPGRLVMLRDGGFGYVTKGAYLTSRDEGASWQTVTTIDRRDGPVIDEALLVETRNGALVAVYRDRENYLLNRTPDNMPLPGARFDVWTVRSIDGGKTWESPSRLFKGYCGAMVDVIWTRENKVVIPLQDLRYDPPRHVTIVYSSTDDGATWQQSDDLDIGGNGLEDGGFEGTLDQRQDGSLLMLLRTSRDRLWWTESNDGIEWTLPTPTDLKASNSPECLLALGSGRLALVWNQLSPERKKKWPRRTQTRYAERPDNVFGEELSLAFSDDHGETWSRPIVIARQPGGKLRYPYLIERHPGEIWLQLKGQWLRFVELEFVTNSK